MGKIVGFEIGDHSVKLVYFAGKELKKAVSVALPDAMVSHGRILSMDAMADFLREAAKANGVPAGGAALTLSAADAFTRDVTVPAMTEQQLAYNLPFEFHDFLTEEKSKYFFDYSVREIRRDPEGYPLEMDLFACAMLKERVEAYRAMFRRAGFKLKVLTPLETAYGALLTEYTRRTGAPEIGRCVVDLGHRGTLMHFLQGGECVGVREIDLGLAELDQRIAEEMGVEIHAVRGYKQSNFNGVLDTEYAKEFYSRLAVEIMKAVNFYHYNNRERELEELYLCGGGAAIRPLRETIAATVKLKVKGGEELLADGMRPAEEPWLYLRPIGGVCEGGLK